MPLQYDIFKKTKNSVVWVEAVEDRHGKETTDQPCIGQN